MSKPSGIKNPKDNRKPLLSIIIPCYNCAKYLDDSVGKFARLAQKNCNKQDECEVEILVIEDASTDDGETAKKCAELDNKFNNITLITLKENKGQAHARNVAFQKATGQYITFADADDTIVDDYFEIVMAKLRNTENSHNTIYVFGAKEQHFDNDNLAEEIEIMPGSDTIIGETEIKACALSLERKVLFGYLWNKIYPASMLKTGHLRIPDEHLIEDHLFNLNAFKLAKSIVCTNEAVYLYARRSSDSVTGKPLTDYFEQYYRRVEEMYDWVCENEDSSTTRPIMPNENREYLLRKSKEVLGAEYIRFSYSQIVRNILPMSKSEQTKWLSNYYDLRLTKELIDDANPEGRLAKMMADALRSQKPSRVLRLAKLIRFVNDNMQWLMIRLRQSR